MKDEDSRAQMPRGREYTPLTDYISRTMLLKTKMFKQHWNMYTILADINKLSDYQTTSTIYELLGDDALDEYNSFQMKEDPSVNNIIN